MTGTNRGYSPSCFGAMVIITQIALLVLYGMTVKYQDETDVNATVEDWDRVTTYYPMYQDVHVMIFIGFGYLMTFLANYSWSSVSYNLLCAVLCIEWGILCDGFWNCVFTGEWDAIELRTDNLVVGDFAAATILISFGGLLGRITPTQLLVMAFFEVFFYSMNEQLIYQKLQAVDEGGSMLIHTFGAYFGLTVSAVLGAPKGDLKKAEKLNSSTYQSDLFSMIGTVFLWMFWPSFNAVLCPINDFRKERVVLNTVLSISCSCMMAFACSRIFEPTHKFNMVHIQNATLAGGVAVGASGDLIVAPYAAMVLGMCAGTLSTAGYVYLSPWLERKGLRDTCGINNLHGMPGILGGIGGILCAGFSGLSAESFSEIYLATSDDGRTAAGQAAYQAAALGCSLGIAIVTGFFVGIFISSGFFAQEMNAFSDAGHFLMDDDEEVEGEKLDEKENTMDQPRRSRLSKQVDGDLTTDL